MVSKLFKNSLLNSYKEGYRLYFNSKQCRECAFSPLIQQQLSYLDKNSLKKLIDLDYNKWLKLTGDKEYKVKKTKKGLKLKRKHYLLTNKEYKELEKII